ncbi:MAG: glycosyltransferase [Bacteroidales bacterium]|nr:glycosyltransferase [Bacteroidales bacterium]
MNDIYIFTNSYPYTKSVEVFIEDEIKVAAQSGYNIIIIPTNRDRIIREHPENITILPCLNDIGIIHKIILFFMMPFDRKFWSMIKGAGLSKRLFYGTKYLYGAYITRYYIKRTIKSPAILYSYWFSYTALGLALAKESNNVVQKCTLISRGHGYDVFSNSRSIYIPLRNYTLSMIDALFPVSDAGTTYLSAHYPDHSAKIKTRRLGILPIKTSMKESVPETISFVSCSSVIKLKRVDLILSMIKQYSENHRNINVSWTHFGYGALYNQIKKACENIPANMKINLNGFTNSNEIHKLYSENAYDIFVNLSTTEGIPVSIMEALSAGIPAIATDVGGNCEIVCDATGVLVPPNVKYSDFEVATDKIIENHSTLKSSTIKFFNEYYNAEKNYKEFYKEIQNIIPNISQEKYHQVIE